MKYSLQDLVAMVPQILASQSAAEINKPIDGYPILHQLMLAMQHDPNPKNYLYYLRLIESVLKHPKSDPNVLDRHGKTPLACMLSEGSTSTIPLPCLEHLFIAL